MTGLGEACQTRRDMNNVPWSSVIAM